MVVEFIGLAQPRELSGFSVDTSAFVGAPFERAGPTLQFRTHLTFFGSLRYRRTWCSSAKQRMGASKGLNNLRQTALIGRLAAAMLPASVGELDCPFQHFVAALT